MPRRALVPLDGSPAAEAAVGHAGALAGVLADEVLLLQVLESPPPSEMAGGDVDWRLRRAEAAAYLRSVAERLAERGIDVETAVAIGDPADEIVRHARQADVEIVVLAAHGRGAAEAFDLGGTCHKVLSLAPASVMVVGRRLGGPPPPRTDDADATASVPDLPAADGATGVPHATDPYGAPPATDPYPAPRSPDPGAEVTYRTILVPLDGSPTSEWALSHANAIARRHGATLLVLHVVPDAAPAFERLPRSPEESELLDRLGRIQEERGDRYLAEVEARLTHTDLPVRTHLSRATRLAEAIRTAATEHGADLIVLAAHGAGGAPGRYGTVAQRLLSVGGLPVIVFQDLPGTFGRAGARSGEASGDGP
jgi:nucleotide-binding universal stress UspA family protein